MIVESSPEPLVDVGIPTRGRSRYLQETIESVLAQTFDRWRLTVSENGPGSDEIRAIVEPYLSDPRVQHVPIGSEISASENATRAIQAGTSPFVALLNDDDRWDAEFLARRVAFLESNQSCGLVFSHCNIIGESGVRDFRLSVPLHEGVQPRGTFLGLLYRRNIIAMPTVLARRSAYDLVGPAFSKSLIFTDYEMWMRVAVRYDVGFLDATDASYRIHSAQTTHAEQARLGEHKLELLDEIDRWLPQDFPTVERRRARSGAYFRASYDAFGRRERRNAAAHLLQAFREHPTALVDRRMLGLAIRSMRFQARQRRLWKEPSTIDRSAS